MSERLNWDQYFLSIATQVATRSTCDRKHVGCVLVVDKTILATGYNGSVRGMPHCDDVGHDLVDSVNSEGKLAPNCVRTVHAEMNAIAQAAKNGTRMDGATAYVTAYPCWPCFRVLVNAGIKSIIYGECYRKDSRVEEAATTLGIELCLLEQ